MATEVDLAKIKKVLDYVVDDVNAGLRRTYLQRSLIVITNALAGVSTINTASDVYELPGRNNFLLQLTVASGTPTGFVVTLQGSLTGNPDVSGDWNAITTHNGIGFHSATDPTPYRYYRLVLTNGTSAGSSINVHFSAIGY